MRLLTSQLSGPGPIVVARLTGHDGYHPVQRAAQAPIYWPLYVGGRTRMVPIRPEQIPPGWDSIQAHVPSVPVTCEQIRCPSFLGGWTEIVAPDGTPALEREGILSRDEAAQITGYYGAASIPPLVIHHPPGTPCPAIHKQADHRIPPLMTVNGRTVLFNEFQDRLAGGLYQAARQ